MPTIAAVIHATNLKHSKTFYMFGRYALIVYYFGTYYRISNKFTLWRKMPPLFTFPVKLLLWLFRRRDPEFSFPFWEWWLFTFEWLLELFPSSGNPANLTRTSLFVFWPIWKLKSCSFAEGSSVLHRLTDSMCLSERNWNTLAILRFSFTDVLNNLSPVFLANFSTS